MPSALSIVTLLTDFGERDSFVASMKGVILGINPHTRIIDLSHRVNPHDVEEAAFVLKLAYRYFPDGTVHIVVVDPGVGSHRRPLLVTTSRYLFVAPDNGVLSYIYQDETDVEVRQIQNNQYRLDSEGATFDGRDLFAPAAAWLTKGQSVGSFGRLIRDFVRLPILDPTWENQTLVGSVVYVDHFGNLISNVTPGHLKELHGVTTRPQPIIHIGSITIEGLSNSYSEGSTDTPRALINSHGHLEIFLKEGRATDRLNITRGERITVT